MRLSRFTRMATLLSSGAIMLQLGGCGDTTAFFDFVQTILLGVTAAGAVVIIQNV